MLVVEFDSALKGGIANNIAVREILGKNTCTRLLFLCELVRVALDCMGILDVGCGTAGNDDVALTKLSVVEEQSGLGSGVLLKDDGSGLGLALRCDLNVGDLATVKKTPVSVKASRGGGFTVTANQAKDWDACKW